MSLSKSSAFGFITALLALAATAPSAKAEFTFLLQQVGPDVVLTGSGTINTAGLTLLNPSVLSAAGISPDNAIVRGGPAPANSNGEFFGGIVGPSSFGSGGFTLATSGSGDIVDTEEGSGLLLPAGYVSGAPLSDTATFANETFATLGFTPGTYTYTFGTGATADSLVVTTVAPGGSSVPLPSSVAMGMLGAVMLGAYGLRMKLKGSPV